jgi:hypothetical protein
MALVRVQAKGNNKKLNKDSKRRNGKTGADSKDIQKQLIHMC